MNKEGILLSLKAIDVAQEKLKAALDKERTVEVDSQFFVDAVSIKMMVDEIIKQWEEKKPKDWLESEEV